MSEAEQAAIHQGVVLTEELYAKLMVWINSNYREQLVPDDLRDPDLIDESLTAIEELARILDLPPKVLLDEE
jgi:succinylarginine dihydrolase